MSGAPSARNVIVAAILAGIIGCAGVWPGTSEQQHEQLQQQQAGRRIAEAQQLAQQAKFTEAVAAFRRVLQEHPGTEWVQEAKYGIALVYASADNPQRDYAAAVAEFDEFLSQYPSDKRAAEAKSWRQALKALLDTRKENDRLHKNIEKLKQLDVRQEEKRLGR